MKVFVVCFLVTYVLWTVVAGGAAKHIQDGHIDKYPAIECVFDGVTYHTIGECLR